MIVFPEDPELAIRFDAAPIRLGSTVWQPFENA